MLVPIQASGVRAVMPGVGIVNLLKIAPRRLSLRKFEGV